jgi:asparagine synthetase B (glutamine-hydrolysing)
MCGIVGCFGGQDVDTVNRMPDVLPHREPDDHSIYTFNNAGKRGISLTTSGISETLLIDMAEYNNRAVRLTDVISLFVTRI